MKTKKTKRANLENYRTIFLQIGFILTLSAIFVAFEWNSAVNTRKSLINSTQWKDIEEYPPVTRPEPEKVDLKPPTPVEKFIIRKDDVDIKEDPIFGDPEIDWDEGVDIQIFEKKKEDVVEDPVLHAQFMPMFQGKDVNYFRNYITENISFPTIARENGISGTVFVEFVIDKDGSVSDIVILRKVNPEIDKAVIEVIKNSPKWEPGFNNGSPVRVKFTIAIKFDLI